MEAHCRGHRAVADRPVAFANKKGRQEGPRFAGAAGKEQQHAAGHTHMGRDVRHLAKTLPPLPVSLETLNTMQAPSKIGN